MEEDKQVILHYLDLIQTSTISRINGGRRRGRINLRETLNSLEGAGGMEEDKKCFMTLFCFISILQILLEEWRERDRINLKETLNSLEGARGMEDDKYVFLHYFVLFQSFKICWRNGG